MRIAEGPRKALAFFGGFLFLAVSTFPLFGGVAKREVRCRGREYTGRFDDCFNDYLPLLEILAPFMALLWLWPFMRFAHTLWAPDPQIRAREWRLASDAPPNTLWPQLQIAGVVLAVWCFYRAALYPVDIETAPYQVTWGIFAVWALVGAAAAWPDRAYDQA